MSSSCWELWRKTVAPPLWDESGQEHVQESERGRDSAHVICGTHKSKASRVCIKRAIFFSSSTFSRTNERRNPTHERHVKRHPSTRSAETCLTKSKKKKKKKSSLDGESTSKTLEKRERKKKGESTSITKRNKRMNKLNSDEHTPKQSERSVCRDRAQIVSTPNKWAV